MLQNGIAAPSNWISWNEHCSSKRDLFFLFFYNREAIPRNKKKQYSTLKCSQVYKFCDACNILRWLKMYLPFFFLLLWNKIGQAIDFSGSARKLNWLVVVVGFFFFGIFCFTLNHKNRYIWLLKYLRRFLVNQPSQLWWQNQSCCRRGPFI